MASGTFPLAQYGSVDVDGRISWSSTASASTNSSKVTVKLQLKGGSSAATGTLTLHKYLEYSLTDKGSTVKDITSENSTTWSSSWTTVQTLTFTVSHKANGSRTIWLGGSVRSRSNPSLFNMDAGGATGRFEINLGTIQRYAKISAATNFTDEENPVITYSVPSKDDTTVLQACISLTGATDDVAYRDIDPSATSYTFELTDAERDVLRNATLEGSASRKVRFYIKSKVDGVDYFKYLDKTFTVVNAEPNLSVFLLDTNSTTSALTGDSLASLIKGYSNVSYETNTSGVKGATIVGQSAVNGETTYTTDSGTFNAVENGKFIFSTTDNRGLTTTKEITLNVIDYFKPTCSQTVEIEMSGETTATVKLVVSGEWSSTHFGAQHNALNIEYRIKAGSGEWSEWTGSNYITDDDDYKITFTINNLDYTKSYTIQSKATDSLDSAETAEYTIKLIPVFDWSEDDFNFNVPVKVKGNLTVEGNIIIGDDSNGVPVDYVIEQGTAAMGSNGTWYWSKWKNGKAECYGIRNYGNMAVSTAWGDLYVSTDFNQALPSGLFAQAPEFISINPQSGGYGSWISKGYQDTPTATTTGTFCLVRSKANNLSAVNLAFNVIGRWK